MFAQWLPPAALAIVLAAAALFWMSYSLSRRRRFHAAAAAIAVAAMLIRCYAGADSALHPWDERYHALVAKNLIAQPLRPMLRADPVLEYDYRNWASNHVWLHKPPLALWMQAASMRAFGISEWPMRFPSLLFSTGAVLATYAIGRALISAPVGLVAAAFHAVGIAVGLAYLTKSLLGLLALPIWAAMRLQTARAIDVTKELIIGATVAAVIAAPWTIYTMRAFPLESAHERAYALQHITEVLENQGGPPWTYLWEMPRFFGELVWIPIGAAVLLLLRQRGTPAHRALLLWVAIPYVLFSMFATKMPAYVMVAAPAIFILQADFWLRLRDLKAATTAHGRRAFLSVSLVVLAVLPARYLLGPSGPLEHRDRNPVWARQLRALNQQIGARRAVIFNVPSDIEAMFYTPYIAYGFPPSAAQADEARRRGYAVYLFDSGRAKQLDANVE